MIKQKIILKNISSKLALQTARFSMNVGTFCETFLGNMLVIFYTQRTTKSPIYLSVMALFCKVEFYDFSVEIICNSSARVQCKC